MIKYKVAFSISGETLFSLLAKVLPIEDLAVEELVDEAELQKIGQSKIAQSSPSSKLAQLLETGRAKRNQPQTLHKRHFVKRRSASPFNPDAGINKILLTCLSTGPHRANDMRAPLKEANYSPSSVGSRLGKLRDRGIVIQHSDGTWSLAKSVMFQTHEESNAPA